MEVLTKSLVHVIFEVAIIITAVLLFKSALSGLFTLVVLAFELSLTSVDSLSAEAVLEVINPVSVVSGILLGIFEDTVPVGLALTPLALVDVAVGLLHAPEASHLVAYELPRVE